MILDGTHEIISQSEVLAVSNLSVSRSGKVIIKDINLNIQKGEFVGIVGPNGGGKSTLLLAILGILKSEKGTIEIFNHKPMSKKMFGKIGWVSQAAANLPRDVRITVQELVNLGTLTAQNFIGLNKENRQNRIDRAIKMVGLEDVKNTANKL